MFGVLVARLAAAVLAYSDNETFNGSFALPTALACRMRVSMCMPTED
jgi:hypothetical protein